MRYAQLTLQNLPQEQARFCLALQKNWMTYIRPHFSTGERIKLLLALSGGADSTAMACIMKILAKHLNLSLVATTINHGLRKDAEEDIAFVENLCRKLEIPCRKRTIPVSEYAEKHCCGIEEAGRILRYKCLEKERVTCNADYISVAHNADDLNEDVLMRLTRGAGWPALGGMPIFEAKRKLIRPMLFLSRKEIELFLTTIGIQWREDCSNDCMAFKRNRFRKKITPLFIEENPQFAKCIQHLWYLANVDKVFWEDYLENALKKNPWQISSTPQSKQIILSRTLLNNLPMAARLRLILLAIKKIYTIKGNINAEKIFAIEHSWNTGKGGKTFLLASNLQAYIRKGNIYIGNKGLS